MKATVLKFIGCVIIAGLCFVVHAQDLHSEGCLPHISCNYHPTIFASY